MMLRKEAVGLTHSGIDKSKAETRCGYCMSCMEALKGESSCPHCGGAAKEPAPHQLRLGTVLIGRYLVGNVIGQGGFGITYIGRDLILDLRVAIKEYFPTGFANRNNNASAEVTASDSVQLDFLKSGKSRFLDEARLLAKFCGEPGVVEVRDFFEANETAYIIMEYLDGEGLSELIERKPLSVEQALGLMGPIMDALVKIHAENVVHRDISPDNIMVLDDGNLKLMDFGAARVFDYSDESSVSIMLKAGYAPEEQYRARGQQGPWTDVYALCATIYKAVTGKTPEDALERLYRDEIQWPSELGVAISSKQEAALQRGMASLAENRFQSIAELREALSSSCDSTVISGGGREESGLVPQYSSAGSLTLAAGQTGSRLVIFGKAVNA